MIASQLILTICKSCFTVLTTVNSTPKRRSRFTRPVFLWALAALVSELVVQWFFKYRGPDSLPLPVTLLPLLPMFLFVVALVRTVQKMDELQKRICLESVYIAFLLTFVFTLCYAGLERAGYYRATWSDVGEPMMLFWAVAYVYSSWRYR